jgi:predicted small metal-binding protein
MMKDTHDMTRIQEAIRELMMMKDTHDMTRIQEDIKEFMMMMVDSIGKGFYKKSLKGTIGQGINTLYETFHSFFLITQSVLATLSYLR